MTTKLRLDSQVTASEDDIKFWWGQIIEHALFLSRLLDPNVVPKLQEEAYNLNALLRQIYPNQPEQFMRFFTPLTALLIRIHDEIKRNKPYRPSVPAINLEIPEEDFHDLIMHMLTEHAYVSRLILSNYVTVKEDILFWAQESSEHLTLISHLLPEGDFNFKLSLIADGLFNNLHHTDLAGLTRLGNFLEQEPAYTKAILDGVEKGVINIDKTMLEHEVREANWGLNRVKYYMDRL